MRGLNPLCRRITPSTRLRGNAPEPSPQQMCRCGASSQEGMNLKQPSHLWGHELPPSCNVSFRHAITSRRRSSAHGFTSKILQGSYGSDGSDRMSPTDSTCCQQGWLEAVCPRPVRCSLGQSSIPLLTSGQETTAGILGYDSAGVEMPCKTPSSWPHPPN